MTTSIFYSLEGSIQQRGGKARLSLRICDGSRIVEAFSRTFTPARFTSLVAALVAVREFLPREFDRDQQVRREVYDPIEAMWSDRIKHGGL